MSKPIGPHPQPGTIDQQPRVHGDQVVGRSGTLEEVVDDRLQHKQSMSTYHQSYSRTYTEAPVQVQSPGYHVVSGFAPTPVAVCRFCGGASMPIITYEPSPVAYILCILCCLVFPIIGLIFGLFIIMSDGFREPRYSCPYCGAYMGSPIYY